METSTDCCTKFLKYIYDCEKYGGYDRNLETLVIAACISGFTLQAGEQVM